MITDIVKFLVSRNITEKFNNLNENSNNQKYNSLSNVYKSFNDPIFSFIVIVLTFIIILLFGKYLWNNCLVSMITIAKPVKSPFKLLGLFILLRILIP